MRKYEIYGVSALLGLALTMGVTACSSSNSNDPTVPEVIEVPKVEVNNTVSGYVNSMSGEGIKGAKVTLNGSSVTTGDDGSFHFEKVATGTWTIDAEADGKNPAVGEVTIAASDNGNHIVNLTLTNVAVKLAKNEDGSSTAETVTETLKDNTAAEIPVAVEAPADIFDEEDADAEITFEPTYDADADILDTKAATRADGDDLFLTGTKLSCSKPKAKLKKSIVITYTVDKEVAKEAKAKKLKDNKWVDCTVSGTDLREGKITIEADEFTTYAIFCSGSITSAESTEKITFTKDTWDNTTGSSAMAVGSAEYTYKSGTDVKGQSDKVLAYLVEMIVRANGAGYKEAVKGSQPINISLPVGAAMSISGTQAVKTITAKMGSKSISAKSYGNVTLTTKSWTRNHTGGGSK